LRLSDLDRLVTPARVRAYPLMLAIGYAACLLVVIFSLKHGVDGWGRAPGSDFITFYAASELGRQGDPAAAFDMARIAAAERAVLPVKDVYVWHYPPPFQLVVTPLAYAPYGWALAGWTLATLAAFLMLVRHISADKRALVVALGAPALFVSLMHGQNATLVTALLGFGLLWLERRPWLAGGLLGLLVIKPHFAVLLPLLLAVQGRWKSFAAAALAAGGLCAVSYLAFGPTVWTAFLQDLPAASRLVQDGELPWAKIPSIFVSALSLGAPAPLAYGLHGLTALVLAAMTAIAWRRPGPMALKIALAAPAILSVSPYCFDYDLLFLALPIGLIADHARRETLPEGVKAALAFGYLAPLPLTALASTTGVQLMPLGTLAVFAAAWTTLRLECRGHSSDLTRSTEPGGANGQRPQGATA